MWQEGRRKACLRSQGKLEVLQKVGLVVPGLHYAELLQSFPEGDHFCGFLLCGTLLLRCKIGDLSSHLFRGIEKMG